MHTLRPPPVFKWSPKAYVPSSTPSSLQYVLLHLCTSPQTFSAPPAWPLLYKTLCHSSTMGGLYLLWSHPVPSIPSTSKGLCRSPCKSPHPPQCWSHLTIASQLNYIDAHTDLTWYLIFVEWNLLALPYQEMHFRTVEELPPRPDWEEVAAGLLEDPLRVLTPMEVNISTYCMASQPLPPLFLPVTSHSAAKPSDHLLSKQPLPSSLPASKHPTMVSHFLLLSNATYPPLFSVKWQKKRFVTSTLVRRMTSKNGTCHVCIATQSRSHVSFVRIATITTAQAMFAARTAWSGGRLFSSAHQVVRYMMMKETYLMEASHQPPLSRNDCVLTP